MNDLITRLEQATEGSQELDAAICRKVGIAVRMVGVRNHLPVDNRDVPIPNYTTSIDAALTLVPEGCSVELIIDNESGISYAFITPSLAIKGGSREFGCTPALALCIAALKARESDNG